MSYLHSRMLNDILTAINSYWYWNNHARGEDQSLRSVDPKQYVVEIANDCGKNAFLFVHLQAVMVKYIEWFIASIYS